jgi:hypothetical protein
MKNLYYFLAITIIFVAISESAKAIPAFARKYNMSCQTCHSPAPRLKAYGDEFAGNGFRFADKQASRYFVETGDAELSLIRDFPLAARFDAHATYNYANSENSDFGVPFILKLLSGGELTEKLSYYFYFYLSERGEMVGVEDCYIQYNNLFGIDLDIYFGQFQVSDPLFKRELRLTLEDYQVYKYKPGLSQMNLAYDRGIMITYGMEWGTDIIFEVVNGCGLNKADGNKLFDIDGHKTIVGRVSQGFGDFFRVGGFVLSGKEDMLNTASDKITNQVMAFGPDATISLGDLLELNLQYVQRKDNNLYLVSSDLNPTKDIETKGAMAELIFTPDGDKSSWYGAGLFNWVESDIKELNYKTATLHFGYLLSRNIRASAEASYNFTDSKNAFPFFSLGIVSAF